MTLASALGTIVKWMDRDIRAYPKTISHMLGLIPSVFMGITNSNLRGPLAAIGWTVSITFGVVWTALVVWRFAAHAKREAIKSDRAFDRKGKFLLSPEYHDSESETAANRRKRLKRSRTTDRK